MIRLIINHQKVELNTHPATMALDILRQTLHLTGVKEGCREGDCGACTVLLGRRHQSGLRYQAVSSCLLPIGELSGTHLVTIEGLNPTQGLNPIQRLLVEEGAVQCGFCTPGIVVSLTGFFLNAESPSAEQAIAALAGNICRCTGYVAINRAVHRMVDELKLHSQPERVTQLIQLQILPGYFTSIPSFITELEPSDSVSQHPNPSPIPESPLWVAGGTDLFVHPSPDLALKELVFINQQPEQHQIKIQTDHIELGAGVTVEEFRNHPSIRQDWPDLHQQLERVSSPQIRNRATLSGNIINASPIGDMIIILLAMETRIRLGESDQSHWIRLEDFYLGYKQLAKSCHEQILAIQIKRPHSDTRFNFEKVSRREHLDIASVNSAARIRSENGSILDIRLSAGGVGPIPIDLKKTSNFLQGRSITLLHLEEAFHIMDLEISPISDVRGSTTYKRRLLRRLIIAHFLRFFPTIPGLDPAGIERLTRFDSAEAWPPAEEETL
ncbi:MAG: FAD binding domain-containing protein [Candidatus Delongbacteria bacterium]|nr:FAD binding domain-containing protein [Candidatus Delongbacteria bacterium]